jgi:hypothetical protein
MPIYCTWQSISERLGGPTTAHNRLTIAYFTPQCQERKCTVRDSVRRGIGQTPDLYADRAFDNLINTPKEWSKEFTSVGTDKFYLHVL